MAQRTRTTMRMNMAPVTVVAKNVLSGGAAVLGVLQAIVMNILARIVNGFALTKNLAAVLITELERMRRAQPIDPASQARPDLFPHGIQIILLTFLAMYLSFRLLRILRNALHIALGIVTSTLQSLTSELPLLDRVTNTLSRDTFILDRDSDSLFDKSGDFRSREITDEESAEWVNAAVRKIWRLYPTKMTSMATEIIQETIDENLADNRPPFVEKIQVDSVDPGERPFWIRNVEKLPTRIDSHLAYNFLFRYSGDASLILRVRLQGPLRRLAVTVPVLVSDIDIEVKSWMRAKLTPDPPYVYEVSGAFAEMPKLDIVLKPFKAVNLMRVPGLDIFLNNLLCKKIPKTFILPHKTLLYMDPDTADVNSFRSIVTETDSDVRGVLAVTLYEATDLSGRTLMGLSHPFCYIRLNDKVIKSKKETRTEKQAGGTDTPFWNQQFELLVRDPKNDVLEIEVHNGLGGVVSRPVGSFQMRLGSLQEGQRNDLWVPLTNSIGDNAKLHLGLNYRAFVDDTDDEDFLQIRESARRKIQKKRAWDETRNEDDADDAEDKIARTGAGSEEESRGDDGDGSRRKSPPVHCNGVRRSSQDVSGAPDEGGRRELKREQFLAWTTGMLRTIFGNQDDVPKTAKVDGNATASGGNEDGDRDKDEAGAAQEAEAIAAKVDAGGDKAPLGQDGGHEQEEEEVKEDTPEQAMEARPPPSRSGDFPMKLVALFQAFFRRDPAPASSGSGAAETARMEPEQTPGDMQMASPPPPPSARSSGRDNQNADTARDLADNASPPAKSPPSSGKRPTEHVEQNAYPLRWPPWVFKGGSSKQEIEMRVNGVALRAEAEAEQGAPNTGREDGGGAHGDEESTLPSTAQILKSIARPYEGLDEVFRGFTNEVKTPHDRTGREGFESVDAEEEKKAAEPSAGRDSGDQDTNVALTAKKPNAGDKREAEAGEGIVER